MPQGGDGFGSAASRHVMRPDQQRQSAGPWRPCGLGMDSGPSLCSWGLRGRVLVRLRLGQRVRRNHSTSSRQQPHRRRGRLPTSAAAPGLSDSASKLLPTAWVIRVSLIPWRRESPRQGLASLDQWVTSCQQGLAWVVFQVAGMENYLFGAWAGIPHSRTWADNLVTLPFPLLAGLLGSAGVLDVVSQPTGHARSLRSSPLVVGLATNSILLTCPLATITLVRFRKCYVHHFWTRPDLL